MVQDVTAEVGFVWRSDDFSRRFMKAKGLMSVAGKDKDAFFSQVDLAQRDSLPLEILGDAFDEPRIFRITVEPAGKQGYPGKVFLLVDDYVYSSAESFAAFSKASK